MSTTATNLLAYAAIGALATPIAMARGEAIAALLCVVAVLGFHIWRKRRGY